MDADKIDRDMVVAWLKMMNLKPSEFEREKICDEKLLQKLLPAGCQILVSNSSVVKKTRETLKYWTLEYIFKTLCGRQSFDEQYRVVLGSLILWNQYLDNPGARKAKKLKLREAISSWKDAKEIKLFFNTQVKDHIVSYHSDKKEAIETIFNEGRFEKMTADILKIISVSNDPLSANQIRGLGEYSYMVINVLALEIDDACREVSAELAKSKAPGSDDFIPGLAVPNVVVLLHMLMQMRCQELPSSCGVTISDATAISRTIESDAGTMRLNYGEALSIFHGSSGVFVGLPHSGRTTFQKLMVFENTKSTVSEIIPIHLSACDLKPYVFGWDAPFEFLADQLIKEELVGVEPHKFLVASLKDLDRAGRILFFIDDLEQLANTDEEMAILRQFALCKSVFFTTTPWSADRILTLMKGINSNRDLKKYSLCTLSHEEKLELLRNLSSGELGGSEKTSELLTNTFSTLLDFPIGIAALFAEVLAGNNITEFNISIRVMNDLLERSGLQSYKIDFNHLPPKITLDEFTSVRYKFEMLGELLAYRKPSDRFNTTLTKIGNGDDLFWASSNLDAIFGSNSVEKSIFERTFLEPKFGDLKTMRFFFPDLHYIILAIHYVIPDINSGTFFGALFVESYYAPTSQLDYDLDEISLLYPDRSTGDFKLFTKVEDRRFARPSQSDSGLDKSSIVRQYQIQLLSMFLKPV